MSDDKQKVVITGCTGSLGRQIVQELLEDGYDVVGIARSQEKLKKLSGDFAQYASNLQLECFDLVRKNELEVLEFLKTIFERGPVQHLVNVIGGVVNFGNFDTLSIDDWRNCVEANVMCHVPVCKAFARDVRARQNPKSATNIIFLSSMVGISPGRFNPHYAASKAGVISLTKYLSQELGPDGIRVNCVSPSRLDDDTLTFDANEIANKKGIDIDMVRAEIVAESSKKTPIGQLATPKDVSGLILWLLSSRAHFVTGANIPIGGV